MAWMAIFVLCTVTPEQSGWTTGGSAVSPYESPNNRPFPGTPSTNPQRPTAAPIVPDYAPTPTYAPSSSLPPSVMAPPSSAPASTGTLWTQLQDALASPATRTPTTGPAGGTANTTGQMRQAGGAAYPPTPPPLAPSSSGVGFPASARQNEVLPPRYSRFNSPTNVANREEVLPPDGGGDLSGPPSDARMGGREILYEGSGQGDSFGQTASYRNKTFVTAPRVTVPEPPNLQPPTNVGLGAGADAQRPAEPLPNESRTNTIGSPTTIPAETKSARNDRSGDGWWPLLLAMLGLFGSLGFNVYLGWIAWDLHGRYQDVVADLHDLENQFDERTSVSDSDRSGRRDSRRVTALAG